MVASARRMSFLLVLMAAGCAGSSAPMMPRVQRPWWTIAHNPDLGELNCVARSKDGKSFERWLMPDGRAGMFAEGDQANARDPVVTVDRTVDPSAQVPSDSVCWSCYYTAHPNNVGAVYYRTSPDLRRWSGARIVSRGGMTGRRPGSCECPFVTFHNGYFYLFRTIRYT